MFWNDHAPPHFHARFAGEECKIDLATLRVLEGGLPPGKMAKVLSWARDHHPELAGCLESLPAAAQTGSDRRLMYQIETATPLDGSRVRLRYRDGYEGEVSLRHLVDEEGVFSFLRDPAQFARLMIGEDGRWLYWVDPEGDQIDLCADALRYEAEERTVEDLAAAE